MDKGMKEGYKGIKRYKRIKRDKGVNKKRELDEVGRRRIEEC